MKYTIADFKSPPTAPIEYTSVVRNFVYISENLDATSSRQTANAERYILKGILKCYELFCLQCN